MHPTTNLERIRRDGDPLPVREFERRTGVQVQLALTGQVALGQMGVDLVYRFGGPEFLEREWDRSDAPDGMPYDAVALDLATARFMAPAEWWTYVRDLDRARIAAGQPGPVAVDPHWRPRPTLPTATRALDGPGVLEGEWH
jgi:hypothetical protein